MDVNQKSNPTGEEYRISKGTFVTHNRKSIKEYPVEQTMGGKNRINNMYKQRNGCNMVSLGDKIYKSPEYSTNYFKEGGLVAGST
jgi:hypothetical protein